MKEAKSALKELQAKYEGLSQLIENQKLDMTNWKNEINRLN